MAPGPGPKISPSIAPSIAMKPVFPACAPAALLALMACACASPPQTRGEPAASAATRSPYESEILAQVDRFLLALGNHDTQTLDEVTITEGVSWIHALPPGEEQEVQPYTNASLLEPSADAEAFTERYWNPIVHARGGLAQVWAPYERRENGKVVYCGIDAFDVVRLDGAWRIASVLSTIEPEACEGLAPGDMSRMRPREGWKAPLGQ